MFFKHLIFTTALGIFAVGCSKQSSQDAAVTGTNTNTTIPSAPEPTVSPDSNTPGSATPEPTATPDLTPSPDPNTPGATPEPTVTPDPVVTPPSFKRQTLTISGSIVAPNTEDTYAFKLCAGKKCDTWQAKIEEGQYSYTFELAQWPLDQVISLEAQNRDQSTVHFFTQFDNLSHLLRMDASDDGTLDENELAMLSLDTVNLAFHTVTKYLLDNDLKQHASLTQHEQHEAVRRYLSEQSLPTKLEINEEQKQLIKDYIDALTPGWTKLFKGELTLQLTPEQWQTLKGNSNTPVTQQVITLNTAQLQTLYEIDHKREAANRLVYLSTQQMNTVRQRSIVSQQSVLELAALYQLLIPQKPTTLILTGRQEYALKQHVAVLNPGNAEPTRFEGPFNLVLDKAQKQLLGLYDENNPADQTAIALTIALTGDEIKAMYQQQRDTEATNKTYLIAAQTWPRGNQSLEEIGVHLLAELKKDPTTPLWQHFRDQFSPDQPLPVLANINLTADRQQHYRFIAGVNALVNANHKHPLKASLIALAPEKKIRISGRFPAELDTVSMSIVLGSRPSPKPGDHFDNGRYPQRHEPIALINSEQQRLTRIDLTGQKDFVITIPLRDVDNLYAHCKPGKPVDEEYNYESTSDEMQDTLTIHLRDEKTGVELRSVLGSFCELARIEEAGNNNGTLEISELDRLNVGYISTAQAALLYKQALTKLGHNIYLIAWSHARILEQYRAMPRKQVEFLAAYLALQAKGQLLGRTINLIERANLFDDLLALINIDMNGAYGGVSNNNEIPSLEILQTNFASTYPIGKVLIDQLDINVSHITQEMTQLLSHSVVDAYYFPSGTRPGSWVAVYPVSTLDLTCQAYLTENQVLGLRLAGKGHNAQDHWVSIGWDASEVNNQYTIGWSTSKFDDLADAEFSLTVNSNLATLTGLANNTSYYIRVQGDGGNPSPLMTYTPGHQFIADTRVTRGVANDDSERGRDSDGGCDLLSGKAKNSNQDGLLGARYVKLDSAGKPLKRQDLTYSQQKFSCVLDAQTGLVWETKHARKDDEDYSIHDDDNMYAATTAEAGSSFSGSCALPNLNVQSTDPSQCNVANQIKWVNNTKLCGLSNWRTPTLPEAYALLDFGQNNRLNMDTRYFPITKLPKTETTYDGWKVIKYGYTHGFWLNSPSLDQQSNRVLVPVHLSAEHRNNTEPHLLMLVSDGFISGNK